jgi:signal transduction histidine kinase
VIQLASSVPLRQWWLRYGVGVLLTLTVVAGRLALDPIWGYQSNRHLVFLPTVMLAAWLGRWGPGVLSATISTVAINYFWSNPVDSFHHPISADLVLFFLASLALAFIIESLHVARARADAARDSRERVLAIVAHDLRNPLSTIKMTSALLQRPSVAPEAIGSRLGTIDRAAARMESLIRDLIDATRLEQRALRVNVHREKVAPILQDVIAQFEPLARGKGIALESGVTAGEASILCDRERLLQVLGNLLGNALNFTPDGGRITLRVNELGDHIRFEVTDTGPGILPEHIPRIFERHWSASGQGTGLGLFIARSIVDAHRGRLWVETGPGRGASFFVTIPRAPEPRAVGHASQEGVSDGAVGTFGL